MGDRVAARGARHPLEGTSVHRAIRARLRAIGPVDERASKSQIAFRRGRGFAYLWVPGMWLAKPAAGSVLSIALPRRIRSRRFKEVVHPSPRVWMHHLEIHTLADLDDEVVSWLRAAYEAAGT